MTARIATEVIERISVTFPDRGEWRKFDCVTLYDSSSKANWKALKDIGQDGGVYAFLLPCDLFKGPRTIHLYGPNGFKIPFEFVVSPLQDDGYGVVYVGKTAQLKNRWQNHLASGDRQTSPLKFGLIDSGVCSQPSEALMCLRAKGRIIYHVLPGPDNCANRDLVEVALIARLRPPFNIKSEH